MDFKIEIAKLLAAAAEISVEDAAAAVEIPAKKGNGRFCVSLFSFGEGIPQGTPDDCCGVNRKIEKPGVYRKDAGGRCIYQLFVDKSVYAEQVLSAVLEQKRESYGKSDMGSQAKPL